MIDDMRYTCLDEIEQIKITTSLAYVIQGGSFTTYCYAFSVNTYRMVFDRVYAR